jgi:hypothetical protein
MEVLDSVTGERLAAAVGQRQGGKGAFRCEGEDTKDAFDYWAKRLRSVSVNCKNSLLGYNHEIWLILTVCGE